MPPASRAPPVFSPITHSLRCGLEESRQASLARIPSQIEPRGQKRFHAIALHLKTYWYNSQVSGV